MYKEFPNIGFIEKKLTKETLNRLNKIIKNKKGEIKNDLAGNIQASYDLVDKNNWFFNTIILPIIVEYREATNNYVMPKFLTKDCQFVMNQFWVNYQKKYEFNPIHTHSGIFSFVVWIKIPSSYNKEKELSFMKNSNLPMPNTFQFVYVNTMGKVSTYNYKLEKSDEGTILLFPSSYAHLVYPFYLSNNKRISLSGNISLDPTKVMT
tara:strand:+ start:273 stop:893 length:621 start_codon:yes stop_codon:yes gene_type:complete